MTESRRRDNGTLAAGLFMAAMGTSTLIWYGIPCVFRAYFSGVAEDNFPLGILIPGILIPGILTPTTTSFVLYAAGAILAVTVAAYLLRNPVRIVSFAAIVILLLLVAEPVAHHLGSQKTEFLTLRDPEGKDVAIIYQDQSTVVAKEIDPVTRRFKPHSGLIEYPNPQRDLTGVMTPRVITR